MRDETWESVERYLAEVVGGEDAALREAVEASAAAGLPAIQVSPLQGKLLMLLARLNGARTILEIGTLGAYSTIWMARALPPGGRLITLEVNPEHARVARENLQRAEVADRVEVRVGDALEMLPLLEQEGVGPFDLVFIDADKPSIPQYLQWALQLSRPGSLIIVDNVVRSGRILDEASEELSIQATRRFHEMVGREPRLDATVIQTVGSKGYDGLTLAVVGSAPSADE